MAVEESVALSFVGKTVYTAIGGIVRAHVAGSEFVVPASYRFKHLRYLTDADTGDRLHGSAFFDNEAEAVEAALAGVRSDLRSIRYEIEDAEARLREGEQSERRLIARQNELHCGANR